MELNLSIQELSEIEALEIRGGFSNVNTFEDCSFGKCEHDVCIHISCTHNSCTHGNCSSNVQMYSSADGCTPPPVTPEG